MILCARVRDGAARSSWRPLTSDSSFLICFFSACTSDTACWLRRPPVRRRALRESTTSRSALIVLALSVSLHRSNIIFASDLTATNSFHLFTRDNKEWKIEQRQHTPLGLFQGAGFLVYNREIIVEGQDVLHDAPTSA